MQRLSRHLSGETVAGTTPASGDWSLLKRTSWGVKPTQNKGENNEIGGSRMAQGATHGTVDVGGDVGTKFRWGQHDDFLASCFGAEWSGDSLTMGNERITFSLATYASDVGIASVVRGAQVGSWKMQIPNDGDITATVTFAGLGWESKADDTNFIKGEPVDSAGKLRYSFKAVSAVSLNGVAGGNGFVSTVLIFSSITNSRHSVVSGPARLMQEQIFRLLLHRPVR